jgi:hypothetical protein
LGNQSLAVAGKFDPKQAEKLARRDAARNKVLNGSIGALSIDTCIFTDAGYRLEGGIFKTLEQFKGNVFSLVFSEVTISEVHRHMAKKADDDRTALISTLRSFGKSWLLPQDEQLRTTAALIGERTGRSIATQRIKSFAERCGISIARASKTLDVDALLKSYFHTKAPFEGSADKKSEFPDAIALLSLQGWALQNNTSVLFVTKDKGCQAFCSESDRLVAIDELDDALALIQERQKVLTLELCKRAEALFVDEDEDEADSLEELRDAIDSQIWDVSWIPEAESADYYEPEMQSVEVLSAEFVRSGNSPKFRAVEYNGAELVAQATVSIEFDATCNFAFSTKDGVDKDMVPIGDAMVTKRSRATVEVLLSFDIGEGDALTLSSTELMSSRCSIDFGFVEPDYSHEDPNADDY